MRNNNQTGMNWGALIACILAVPVALGWAVVSLVGGSIVCADPEAHCGSVAWSFVEGLCIIALIAVALGYAVNMALRRLRRRK